MGQRLDQRIPFPEFFAMDHPGAPKIGGKPNPAAGHGFAGGMSRTYIYYMETVTVVEFLEAAAGAEGFRKILKTLQTGAKRSCTSRSSTRATWRGWRRCS